MIYYFLINETEKYEFVKFIETYNQKSELYDVRSFRYIYILNHGFDLDVVFQIIEEKDKNRLPVLPDKSEYSLYKIIFLDENDELEFKLIFDNRFQMISDI